MKLKARDYIQIVNTFLMLGLGSVILVKAIRMSLTWNLYLVSGLMIVFGIYRVLCIGRYFVKGPL
jgi:hypothetical protein